MSACPPCDFNRRGARPQVPATVRTTCRLATRWIAAQESGRWRQPEQGRADRFFPRRRHPPNFPAFFDFIAATGAPLRPRGGQVIHRRMRRPCSFRGRSDGPPAPLCWLVAGLAPGATHDHRQPQLTMKRASHAGVIAAIASAAVLLTAGQAAAATVERITSFGNNPTGIGMYLYTPSSAVSHPPILVGVHACHGKGTDVCASGTPFAAQADKYGFLLVCPSAVSSDGCWDVHSSAVADPQRRQRPARHRLDGQLRRATLRTATPAGSS